MKANPYTWIRAALQYVFQRSGQAVPQPLVKAGCEAVVNRANFGILDAALKMQQGSLGVPEFYAEIKEQIRMAHIAAAALARGGFNEMRPADWKRVEAIVEREFQYARGFAEDIAAGRYGTPGSTLRQAVLSRAGIYSNAPRATYENERTALHQESGFVYATRIKGAVDSCPTCEAEADVKRPIDDVVPIGESECRANCHCVLIFSRN